MSLTGSRLLRNWKVPEFPPKVVTLPEYMNLRQIFGSSVFRASYSPSFAPFRRDREALCNRNSASHLFLQDRYQRLTPDRLRWLVNSGTALKALPKSVQRQRGRRRLQAAFLSSLNQNGFTRDGQHKDGYRSLIGTLEILMVTADVVTADFKDLLVSTNRLVQMLKRQSGNRQRANLDKLEMMRLTDPKKQPASLNAGDWQFRMIKSES